MLKHLHTKPFQLQVWFVVMAIAGLRTLKSVVQDLSGPVINTKGLAIDLLILAIFCGLALLIYFKKIPRIPLVVGVALLILLILSYVQFGGVMGMSEFNLMGVGVLFALAYNRKELVIIMSLYLLLIIIANLDLRFNGWLTRSFFKDTSTGVDNYLTTTLTLTLIILYFKKALVAESNRITQLRKKLSEQMKMIGRQKRELESKKHFLHEVNSRLQMEIQSHANEIGRQNNAMKDYIWLSTESLQMPLKQISESADKLSHTSDLEKILKEQVIELNTIVESLKRDLIKHQNTKY
ncbi:MAG TPA: hypothetical protein VFZ52_17900 [Chryseolinea sp.]